MTQSPSSNSLHAGAAGLIRSAASGDPADFGTRYGALLDDPQVDLATGEILAVLRVQVAGWLPAEVTAEEAIGIVHDRMWQLYPRCLAVLAVNLVVLEHVARSVVGLSDFLRTLDGASACLYGALLAGCALSLSGCAADGELAGLLDG